MDRYNPKMHEVQIYTFYFNFVEKGKEQAREPETDVHGCKK